MPLTTLISRFERTTAGFIPGKELEEAIKKAHADMSRRATGHTPDVQAESVSWFKEYFTDNSPYSIGSQPDFDAWHEKTCTEYCDHMNAKEFSFVMTCGRAQKVLNMIFKYLYCTKAYRRDVAKITPFLHMTLDGYTLRWYKEVVMKDYNAHLESGSPKLKAGDISDWSKMNEPGKQQYIDIQKRIRDYLDAASNYEYSINVATVDESLQEKQNVKIIDVKIPLAPGRKCPFFAEFIVWEGEIVRAKIRNLLIGLNGTAASWADDSWATSPAVVSELRTKLNALLMAL